MNAIMLKQSPGKLIGKIWQDAKFSARITMRPDMYVRAERTTFSVAPRQNGLQSRNHLLNIRNFIDRNRFNVIGPGT